jgi:hypothetical protein
VRPAMPPRRRRWPVRQEGDKPSDASRRMNQGGHHGLAMVTESLIGQAKISVHRSAPAQSYMGAASRSAVSCSEESQGRHLLRSNDRSALRSRRRGVHTGVGAAGTDHTSRSSPEDPLRSDREPEGLTGPRSNCETGEGSSHVCQRQSEIALKPPV